METTTPFDLNQAIQCWRENLAQSPAFRSENLYELETHLRDSIALLQRKDLTAEESFLIATKRIGNNGMLEAEFAKQNARSVWLDRALWILFGAQLWSLASVLSFQLQTILRGCLPRANEWLAACGFGRISESIPGQVFYVIALPLTVLGSAKICSLFHHWAERRGWSPLGFILGQPRLLAFVYGLLCFAPAAIYYGMGLLVQKYSLERYSGMSPASGYTSFILAVFQVTVFAMIVMVIARRRLRLSRS
jgi:hypothetical protein